VDRISVTKTPDGLKAFMAVPESMVANYPPFDDLKKFLVDFGVVYGIDDNALHQMVRNKTYNIPVEVAHGTPVTPATPGRIDILVDVSSRGKPKARAGGRVDLRDLGYVVNVRKNAQIIRRIPPVPGKEGKMVTGKTLGVIQPPNLMLLPGKGTRILEGDPNMLVADVDGAVMVYPNGKAEVLTDKVIPSSIDYATGNIFFSGNLQIKGTVRSGFEVEAEGNVWITGSVEDAKVSALADLEIVGGAAGSGNGIIKCAGRLKTRHIQNLTVRARDVVVSEDVVHCDIWAEAGISAKAIVGGTVSAGKLIEADSVGTEAEAKTVVDLGGMGVLLKQKYDLLRDLATVTGDIGTLKGTMFRLVRDEMDEKGELPAGPLSRLEELRKQNRELLDKNDAIQKEVETIDEKLKSSTVPVLRAGVVFPNTVIKAGNLEKLVKEKLVNVVITLDQNAIVVNRG
jgi:uncharacterized protein (DUF342 family)